MDYRKNLDEILGNVRHYFPDADTALIERAFDFAEKAHAGQKRDSGEPYIIHPLKVAEILTGVKMDPVTLSASLLHDVIEDTSFTEEDIKKEFGEEIARLVSGVTAISSLKSEKKEEMYVENLRKMLIAMARDIRVILIKLADKLHNMRTLSYLQPERRKKIASETLDIYAPIANRLGIFRFKSELEDLAFQNLYPEQYEEIRAQLRPVLEENELFIDGIISRLREKLEASGIVTEISGRTKHFYSIYKKIARDKRSLSEIYDITALRVITDSLKDCYGALGLVHSIWKPLPGRFKDYIAMPKSNMYQAIHTTLVSGEGRVFEVQIKTRKMYETAEYGIAAHWQYKEGVPSDARFGEKFMWLRQIMEWLTDNKDPKEFMHNLKIDLFDDEVYVFTPLGDIKVLPKGSTIIDFAYSIHSGLGDSCTGGKVNGSMVPLRTQLKIGDIVEIISGKNQKPSRDWLLFVVTAKAKNRIKHFLKTADHEENYQAGRSILERELEKHKLSLSRIQRSPLLAEALKNAGLKTLDDAVVNIGISKLSAAHFIGNFIQSIPKKEHEEHDPAAAQSSMEGLVSADIKNMQLRYAKCCSPVPGDSVAGYITSAHEVSVHRLDCPNMTRMKDKSGRMIRIDWSEDVRKKYYMKFEVLADDRKGLLADLSSAISGSGNNIFQASLFTREGGAAKAVFTIEVGDAREIQNVINSINKVKNVFSVKRIITS